MRTLAVLLALVFAAPAAAYTQTTRDAPWRLTGISKDRRTLRVVYEGSGCLRGDGAPVVDESAAGRVRVTVRQTVDHPEGYEVCILPLIFYPLDVPLAAPLDGRRVVGGPRFAAQGPPPKRMPRVIGLRRGDAVRALKGQGLKPRGLKARHGVIVRQRPRPGRRLSRR